MSTGSLSLTGASGPRPLLEAERGPPGQGCPVVLPPDPGAAGAELRRALVTHYTEAETRPWPQRGPRVSCDSEECVARVAHHF